MAKKQDDITSEGNPSQLVLRVPRSIRVALEECTKAVSRHAGVRVKLSEVHRVLLVEALRARGHLPPEELSEGTSKRKRKAE